MKLGILKDIKKGEYRVVLTPTEVEILTESGCIVYAQHDCGKASGFPNNKYKSAGAVILKSAADIFETCDMVAKVKEFDSSEYEYLREGQILFSCIHPAANPDEVQALLKSKVISITAEDSHRYGSPLSEAAGKQGALFGLESMLTINGGKGKFVSGLAGAPGMKVLILGIGIVGRAALQVLHSLGAWITAMDVNVKAMRDVNMIYNERINTMYCTKQAIRKLLPETDMIINCVKWDKSRTDHLIDKDMLRLMEPGSVIVDISNDIPGAIESTRETTHKDPRYIVNNVVHYCVSNIPSAIANSASSAYASEILPRFLNIYRYGLNEACVMDGYLRRSLTTYKGILTHEETSAVQNIQWLPPEKVLRIDIANLDYAPPATPTRSENYVE